MDGGSWGSGGGGRSGTVLTSFGGDRFEVLSCLGHGAAGWVYRARTEPSVLGFSRDVCIKRLSGQLSPEGERAMREEARILSNLPSRERRVAPRRRTGAMRVAVPGPRVHRWRRSSRPPEGGILGRGGAAGRARGRATESPSRPRRALRRLRARPRPRGRSTGDSRPRPPRRDAAQRAGLSRGGDQAHRFRHRPRARSRPLDDAEHGEGKVGIHGPRADPRRAPRRPDGPLRGGCHPLRASHRATPLVRAARHAGRGCARSSGAKSRPFSSSGRGSTTSSEARSTDSSRSTSATASRPATQPSARSRLLRKGRRGPSGSPRSSRQSCPAPASPLQR